VGPADLFLLQTIRLPPDAWDVIIVGDGSGSRYGWPGGWAAVLFDKATGLRKLLYGALSDTTVNVMELSPYIYSMMWYSRGPGKDLQKQLREATQVGIAPRMVQVHIITDCEIIADQGRRIKARDTNRPLWQTMDDFERLGYSFHWYHVERDLLAANRLCDFLSKEMRKATMQIQLPDVYDDQYGLPKAE
jgi:ribonuclease HI